MAKTADRIGVGVEELQELRHAFDIGGVAAAQTDKALGFFAKSVGEAATGTGEALPIFKAMGIAIHDLTATCARLAHSWMTLPTLWPSKKTPRKRQFAATRLFGRAGMGLINTLDDGSEASSGDRGRGP